MKNWVRVGAVSAIAVLMLWRVAPGQNAAISPTGPLATNSITTSSNISTTTVFTAPATAQYKVSVYIAQTVACAGAPNTSNIFTTIYWTDNSGTGQSTANLPTFIPSQTLPNNSTIYQITNVDAAQVYNVLVAAGQTIQYSSVISLASSCSTGAFAFNVSVTL